MTDTIVKSEQTGGTHDLEKKRRSNKTIAQDGSSEVSASVSEDSLLAAADNLIHDIDDAIGPSTRKDVVVHNIGPAAIKGEVVNAIGPVARKGEVVHSFGSAARKGEIVHTIGPAASKDLVVNAIEPVVSKGELSSCTATIINLEAFPSEKYARLEAFDGTGSVDLDAVEKWTSTSNFDINLNKTKENTNSVTYIDENTNVPNKLQKADTAVAEINAIIKTVSVNKSKKTLKQPIFKSQSSAEKSIKAPFPILSSTTNEFNSDLPEILPTTPFAKPLQSIRLPPVKTASLPSEDIFHRKLEDMSLLHIPHRLPKLDPQNHKPTLKEKSSTDVKEKVKFSNNASTSDQVVKNNQQYFLPGQVPEKGSEDEIDGVVEVRNIILDYSSTKKASTQINKDNRCGVFKVCTRLCCCRGQTYEADDLEEGDMETKNETKKRSLPRRIWKRIKRCFGL